MTTPRAQRRATDRAARKLRKKLLAHRCVLDRAAQNAGVAVEVQPGHEQHKLHTAHGEPWCTACEVCSALRAQGRGPTLLTAAEVVQQLNHWARKVAAVKHQIACDEAGETIPTMLAKHPGLAHLKSGSTCPGCEECMPDMAPLVVFADKSAAGPVRVVDTLLDLATAQPWTDEDGTEHDGAPLISRESALQALKQMGQEQEG